MKWRWNKGKEAAALGFFLVQQSFFVDVPCEPHRIALLVTSLEAVKNQDKVIGVQQESVDFHRAVSASVNSVDFGEFAKCLANDHINIGRNRLMAWLRKEKYIDASNIAYQKYIQQGIFEVKETVYYIGKASHTARKTLITPKGQVYLAKKVSSGYKG